MTKASTPMVFLQARSTDVAWEDKSSSVKHELYLLCAESGGTMRMACCGTPLLRKATIRILVVRVCGVDTSKGATHRHNTLRTEAPHTALRTEAAAVPADSPARTHHLRTCLSGGRPQASCSRAPTCALALRPCAAASLRSTTHGMRTSVSIGRRERRQARQQMACAPL